MTAATNKLTSVRKIDNEIGAILSDISDFVINEDYARALQAGCYLVVALGLKAGTKPFTALRSVYKAS